jgi:hypothetical protein
MLWFERVERLEADACDFAGPFQRIVTICSDSRLSFAKIERLVLHECDKNNQHSFRSESQWPGELTSEIC